MAVMPEQMETKSVDMNKVANTAEKMINEDENDMPENMDLALMAAKEGLDGLLTDVNSGSIKDLAMKYYKNDAKFIINGAAQPDIQRAWNKVIVVDGVKGFSWTNEKWEK